MKILYQKQEFLFSKVAPRKSKTDIVLLGFLINAAPRTVYFNLHYHSFFRKELFFQSLYFSEYDIRMILFIFWLRNRLSIKYAHN